jgi:hypothetical protein
LVTPRSILHAATSYYTLLAPTCTFSIIKRRLEPTATSSRTVAADNTADFFLPHRRGLAEAQAVDFSAMAAARRSCPEVKEMMNSNTLQITTQAVGDASLLGDVSTGVFRPPETEFFNGINSSLLRLEFCPPHRFFAQINPIHEKTLSFLVSLLFLYGFLKPEGSMVF